MSQCPLCTIRGKNWNGSEPKCAFDEAGVFTADNWNCATMNHLRAMMTEVWSEDQNAGILPVPGQPEHLCLSWHKGRGKVDVALIISDAGQRNLAFTDLLGAEWAKRPLVAMSNFIATGSPSSK